AAFARAFALAFALLPCCTPPPLPGLLTRTPALRLLGEFWLALALAFAFPLPLPLPLLPLPLLPLPLPFALPLPLPPTLAEASAAAEATFPCEVPPSSVSCPTCTVTLVFAGVDCDAVAFAPALLATALLVLLVGVLLPAGVLVVLLVLLGASVVLGV